MLPLVECPLDAKVRQRTKRSCLPLPPTQSGGCLRKQGNRGSRFPCRAACAGGWRWNFRSKPWARCLVGFALRAQLSPSVAKLLNTSNRGPCESRRPLPGHGFSSCRSLHCVGCTEEPLGSQDLLVSDGQKVCAGCPQREGHWLRCVLRGLPLSICSAAGPGLTLGPTLRSQLDGGGGFEVPHPSADSQRS